MNQNENEKMNKQKNEVFSKGMKKASDIAKKTAAGISKGATVISEKTKELTIKHQIKKYSPLFLKEFKSKNFNVPNIIKIVDEAIRRDIEVCDGAIGWRDTENETEVLYLYDEAVKDSGIEFVPHAACDQIYYVDHFNRKRFIQVDSIFERAHSEKLAELEHIAYSLGAKSCLIEIFESDTEKTLKKTGNTTTTQVGKFANTKNASAGTDVTTSVSTENETTKESYSSRSGKTRTYFQGNNIPKRPALKWFANDDNIKGLIEMRCSGNNSILARTLELSGSTSVTMSQSIACTIDNLISSNVAIRKSKAAKTVALNNSTSMLTKAIKESNRTLIFDIEF